jgi:hypothetical protein
MFLNKINLYLINSNVYYYKILFNKIYYIIDFIIIIKYFFLCFFIYLYLFLYYNI